MGFAYIAPAKLELRAELDAGAPVTATLAHAERVEILETRRKFVRVRAASGATGWTDAADLLTQAQIDALNALTARAVALPPQGTATVYATLNVHAAPSRSASSILQIREGDQIQVLAHRVSPRTPASQASDDWFLVRTGEGRAGWVLMRAVLLLVPDEVAQYADRQWITSYHALGETHDARRGKKNHWLWTTLVRGSQPFDFDSFRVFVHNPRRGRYETVLLERNLRGYLPVETSQTPDGTVFTLLVEGKDGQIEKRTYLFKDLRVRLTSRALGKLPEPLPEVRPATAFDAVDREERWWRRLAREWFGR